MAGIDDDGCDEGSAGGCVPTGGIPEESVKYFEGAYIEKVKVSRRNRSWTFYLVLGTPVPPQILFAVQDRIRETFRSMAEIRFSIRYGQANLSQLMEMYWQWIRKRVSDNFHLCVGWLAQAEWQLEGERLILVFANPMMHQMAVSKQLDQVVASFFHEISGTRIHVALTFRESDVARERFLEEREEAERQLVEEAMIHLEESMPPEESAE